MTEIYFVRHGQASWGARTLGIDLPAEATLDPLYDDYLAAPP